MSSIKNDLVRRLENRSAVIGVVGLGYVGLPLALRYSEAGFAVVGFDTDPAKPELLNTGDTYFSHVSGERIARARESGFEATADYSRAANVDAVILCVPTPLHDNREPDLSYVVSSMDSIVPFLRKGQVVSLESTTYPGTTEEVILPRLTDLGLSVGEEIFLVYSPEREDPGNPSYDTASIPKVCAGYSAHCLEVATALYGQAVEQVVPVSSLKAAEMTKLLENIYRAVNIGMVNEMKVVADAMDIDIYEVIEAASTKPFGYSPFYPGPGLGGHCIPIDPFYLSWKARQCGVESRFIELAGEVNTAMPQWIVEKLARELERTGKGLDASRVLTLGIAYKKNIDDTRESPAVALMELLVAAGAEIAYSDPLVPVFPKKRRHRFELESVTLDPESLAAFDAVIIATDHDAFDYDLIRRHARLIVDTRGRYARQPDQHIIPA